MILTLNRPSKDRQINNSNRLAHYSDVIMSGIASQITSLTIVYSTVYSDADQRKHQSSASLAFVRGIHRGPVNSPHKWPVTRKMFPFDEVIMGSHICSETFCPSSTSWMIALLWLFYVNCSSITAGLFVKRFHNGNEMDARQIDYQTYFAFITISFHGVYIHPFALRYTS